MRGEEPILGFAWTDHVSFLAWGGVTLGGTLIYSLAKNKYAKPLGPIFVAFCTGKGTFAA